MLKIAPGIEDRLRAERERLGLTQADVATQLGIGRRTVINHETGAHPLPFNYVERLSTLGADAFYLFFGVRYSDCVDMPDPAILEIVLEWATLLCKDRKGVPFSATRTARFMAKAYAYLAQDVGAHGAKEDQELELLNIARNVA